MLTVERDGSRVVDERTARHIHNLGLEPLVAAPGLARLEAIRFLGVLARDAHTDSRLDHSLGVASLTASALERLGCSVEVVRHAAAAALLHDASQWALSHSAEGAFRRLSGLSNHQLTQALLYDSPILEPRFHLGATLQRLNLERDWVYALLLKDRTMLPSQDEWSWPVFLARSPFCPDTLDGITRTCRIAAVDCPCPEQVLDSFLSCWNGVSGSATSCLDDFWTAKARVYDCFLHSPESLAAEMQWGLRVFAHYQGRTAAELFALTDDDVLQALGSAQAPPLDPDQEPWGWNLRFRQPRCYFIDEGVEPLDCNGLGEINRRYRSEERHDLGGKAQLAGSTAR